MKEPKIFILIILFGAIVFLSFNVYKTANKKRMVKEDLIELSKIKYGLFSVDEWKQILASIITKKVGEFNFDGANRDNMRKEISAFLYKQIDQFEQRFREQNSGTLTGFFKTSILSLAGGFSDIKRDIPKITEDIIDFMNNPKNRKAVREFIIQKMNAYADNTFSKIDYSTHNEILTKYNYKDRGEAITGLTDKIKTLDDESKAYENSLLIVAGLTGLYIILSTRLSKNEFLVITISCFVLLIIGLLLPMIEIDARIANMTFSLLGESVSFQDQVLYYKSKSILEVVRLMITQGRVDLICVGILVLTFSILFPVAKSISSILYVYLPNLKSSKFIQFMVFKTGKWSMADVMVVAIFMAYIGFAGIITEQLKQLETLAQNIDILTTNKSALQAGFFAFTSFSVLSLLISHKLQYEISTPDRPLL
ncbi:paraquat-inducible protein A [Chryseolinea sp. H1M3-3]|uniref:paraquat-inducible protein A n=1 Tax=Chryseolinea sp. H1M3-3 TaxID=3034144 RepID=UPI0023EDB20E|nr:paraquat-inducible protein A [Chryseolinea sp. H1M3-3]